MIDFAELKSKVPIEQVLQLLGIAFKRHANQLRGCCPIHKGTDQRGFVVTPSKGLWFCFGGCGGGDQIKLVSKMRDCDAKTAAQWIADSTGTIPQNTTVPRKGTVPQEQKAEFNPPVRKNFAASGGAGWVIINSLIEGALSILHETLKVEQ